MFAGKYECWCPRHSTGINCEVFDLNASPGTGRPTVVPPVVNPMQVHCANADCALAAGNGQCDVSNGLLTNDSNSNERNATGYQQGYLQLV